MTTSVPLALLFAAAAVFSLHEMFRTPRQFGSYLADREAHGAHVVMNATMAAMFAPFSSLALERSSFWLLTIGALVLLARAVHAALAKEGERAGGSIYHGLAMLAMIYAMVLMPTAMEHHGPAMNATMAMVQPTPLPALILGIAFALDGVLTAGLVLFRPRLVLSQADNSLAPRSPHRTISLIRRAAIPHVIMDAGMVLMLL